MYTKQISLVILFWALALFGVTPELQALNIESSAVSEQQKASAGIEHLHSLQMSSEQIRELLPPEAVEQFIQAGVKGGGYYSSSTSNQYDSFFGNAEAFLTELVEFFLFLALLSYVVGYEEWLPWEQEE